MMNVGSRRRRRVLAIIGHSASADRDQRNRNRVCVLAAIQRADLVVVELYELRQNPVLDELTVQRLKRHLRVLRRGESTDLSFAVAPFGTFNVPLPLTGCDVLWLPDPLRED